MQHRKIATCPGIPIAIIMHRIDTLRTGAAKEKDVVHGIFVWPGDYRMAPQKSQGPESIGSSGAYMRLYTNNTCIWYVVYDVDPQGVFIIERPRVMHQPETASNELVATHRTEIVALMHEAAGNVLLGM